MAIDLKDCCTDPLAPPSIRTKIADCRMTDAAATAAAAAAAVGLQHCRHRSQRLTHAAVRCLFGRPDRLQMKADLARISEQLLAAKSRLWNFDFAAGLPLPPCDHKSGVTPSAGHPDAEGAASSGDCVAWSALENVDIPSPRYAWSCVADVSRDSFHFDRTVIAPGACDATRTSEVDASMSPSSHFTSSCRNPQQIDVADRLLTTSLAGDDDVCNNRLRSLGASTDVIASCFRRLTKPHLSVNGPFRVASVGGLWRRCPQLRRDVTVSRRHRFRAATIRKVDVKTDVSQRLRRRIIPGKFRAENALNFSSVWLHAEGARPCEYNA